MWRRELMSLEERIQAASEQLPDKGVIFCKHMAKHSFLYDFENEPCPDSDKVAVAHKHLLLVRNPVSVLSSWGVAGSVHGNNPTPVGTSASCVIGF